MDFFTNAPGFRFQTQRLLSQCIAGGGEATEVGWAVSRIADNDLESWHEAWSWLADRARRNGDEALAENHRVSARAHYLRAANYFRQADFFLSHDDAREVPTWQRMVDTFAKFGELSNPPFEWLTVTLDTGETVPGYLVRPAVANGRLPTVVYVNGADGTKEESYFLGKGFVDRGMNFVTIDGPGQGEPLRKRQIYTRPDYEAVVSPLVDQLVQRDDVDPTRLALVGVSMGGYYATRAACFEPRFRCLLVHGACSNIHDDLYNNYPRIRPHLQWVTGTFDDQKARTRLQEFDLAPHLERITMPVFIGHGEDDFLTSPAGAEKTFKGLVKVADEDKTLRIYTREENASAHVQVDNPTEAWPEMQDWVRDRLTK